MLEPRLTAFRAFGDLWRACFRYFFARFHCSHALMFAQGLRQHDGRESDCDDLTSTRTSLGRVIAD
jgi:hypothetical protein